REERERKKAIRLSMRAKRQDIAKLLNRRRKARKNARAAQRAELASKGNQGSETTAPQGEAVENVAVATAESEPATAE
ncbi:MAG: hypothetical protein ACI9EF_001944, partial [Pseudohongiellaceae bacterium]